MDAKLDEKFGKIGDKLYNDFAERKNGLEHINAKVCTIRQLIPRAMEATIRKKNPKIVELDSFGKSKKNLGSTSELGISLRANLLLIKDQVVMTISWILL